MINYVIKRIPRVDNKTEWCVYENGLLIDSALSYERARAILAAYKQMMR